jgi:uncharacterized protein YqeY
MNTIQDKVTDILKSTKDKAVRNALRIVKAEFQREKTKEVDDARAVKIIRELIKAEKERVKHIDVYKKGGSEDKTNAIEYIHVLTGFLPVMVGEEEVRDWIIDNIDFSEFKNPMQAMKFIMEHFGTRVDGNTVKGIIENLT